ncbi:MAG: M3 family metallopeptidase [Pseudomonadales bacterium]|jgi:oligopeptidase A|nr:M3 family metallopeptidase [Pseudomonadales bacterium]
MTNPLLEPAGLPAFDRIRPDDVAPALDQVLAENLALLETVAETGTDWSTIVEPLEEAGDRLSRVWSPVRHLHSVADNEALRVVYEAALPRLTAYSNSFGQHRGLFAAYERLAAAPGFASEEPARRAAVEHALRDFRLSGIALSEPDQARFREISQRLSELGNRFSQNLLDATDAWSMTLAEARLAGLPPATRERAREEARRQGIEGAVIGLDGPTYLAVMTHAEDRELRRAVYEAWTTRASDCGPHAGRFDNTTLIEEILALRHELAGLLGFRSWAERQLEGRMARSADEVLGFLRDLARRSRPRAQAEYAELETFARDELDLDALEAWDLAWAAEKLRRARFDVSQEDLRPYFPADRVIEGMFEIARRLFDIRIEVRSDWAVWNDDVRTYEILRDGAPVGRFYLDLYARRHKRGGAWMDGCIGRRRIREGMQVPVAFLTCNFSGPVGDRPALLTHDEVTTLFHEFGHGLHHMLTQIEVADVAGISGVPWDAVELPSQFLENWCWQAEAIPLISGHWETGEPLPTALLDRLLAARNFQSALTMVRQLELGLFDFRLHHEYVPGGAESVRDLLQAVRDEVAVVQPPAFNRFENGFGHIFSGGYAAGYYSYKWAEVLSADAFSRFEETGVFDPQTGAAFLECILERGGSEPPAVLFRRFRGRDPDVSALLRHSGIEGEAGAAA